MEPSRLLCAEMEIEPRMRYRSADTRTQACGLRRRRRFHIVKPNHATASSASIATNHAIERSPKGSNRVAAMHGYQITLASALSSSGSPISQLPLSVGLSVLMVSA